MEIYLEPLRRYADFSGRSSRSEYWVFVIVNFVITLVGEVIMASSHDVLGLIIAFGVAIFCLYTLIPSLAVTFRRLHDTGHSAWWLLIGFIPILGGIVLLIFFLSGSDPSINEYGPPPN